MSANGNSAAVRFLYGTGTGRAVLRLMQKGRADRLVVGFLKSPLSKPFIRWYAGRPVSYTHLDVYKRKPLSPRLLKL